MEIDEKTGRVTIKGLILGHLSFGKNVSRKQEGWYFIPACSGRKSGRVLRQTREEAIPAWVKRAAKA